MYNRKTIDEYTLLGYYGAYHGWEEVTTESSFAEIKQRQKEYIINQPCWNYKIVKKRVKLSKESENGTAE